jgi:hypothetical protein
VGISQYAYFSLQENIYYSPLKSLEFVNFLFSFVTAAAQLVRRDAAQELLKAPASVFKNMSAADAD